MHADGHWFIGADATGTHTEVLFKPWFPGYIGVAYEWFWFLLFFLFGYVCITAKEEYYRFIESKRVLITALAAAWTVAFVWIRLEQHDSGIPYVDGGCLLYTSPSPRDKRQSRMPSSA